MIEIEKPSINVEDLSEDGSFGRFVVEPLESCLLYTSDAADD